MRYIRNDRKPFHGVNHRQIGNIPNITLAPRGGTFVSTDVSVTRAEMMERANSYEKDVLLYIDGKLPKEQIFRSLSAPIYGAYGEKL